MLAFLTISTHLGGAERSLLDLLKALRQEGQSFTALTPKEQGPLIDEFNKANIPHQALTMPRLLLSLSRNKKGAFLMTLPLIPFLLMGYVCRMHFWLKKNQISCVHSTGLKLHLILGFYSFLQPRIKVIIHLRDIIHHPLLRFLLKIIALNKKNIWVSNSQITAESIAPISSEVIYNGFPPPPQKNSSVSFREKWQLPETAYLIGIVAAIARWKGQREFLLMAEKLLQQNSNFYFLVIGDEIYDTTGETGELQTLKNLSESLQITKHVRFIGFQKNIFEIYQNLDVVVHSSIQPEPFGRVIVEAMQAGRPVTASNQGGPIEIITPYDNGLLHAPGNPQTMADNVRFFHDNPEKTQQIREQAQLSSSQFSMQSHVEKMKTTLGLS